MGFELIGEIVVKVAIFKKKKRDVIVREREESKNKNETREQT